MEHAIDSHLQDIERARQEILIITNGLSNQQCNWRPEPGRWSIGECLEHLLITGSKLLGPMRAAIERGRQRGLRGTGPFAYGFVGARFVKSLQPVGARPVRTQRIYTPGSSQEIERVVPQLLELQNALADALTSADGLDLSRIKFRSPAMPLLRLNLAAWFAATVAHEHRHLQQARRVLEHPAFPGTNTFESS